MFAKYRLAILSTFVIGKTVFNKRISRIFLFFGYLINGIFICSTVPASSLRVLVGRLVRNRLVSVLDQIIVVHR